VFDLILYQPEIPPNTGNIIRLCANTGTSLHLVRPLGFEFGDSRLRRAGLDYREFAPVHAHDSLAACLSALHHPRVLAFSTRGPVSHADFEYRRGDALLFGPETRGLPGAVLGDSAIAAVLRIPMRPHSRSLNLSNAAAVVVYEAWRQQAFNGAHQK